MFVPWSQKDEAVRWQPFLFDDRGISDRETGRPRGFAFVAMSNDNEARAAIEALNGTDLDGRTITVNEARPKSNAGGGGGGRGGPRGAGRSSGGGGGGRDRW